MQDSEASGQGGSASHDALTADQIAAVTEAVAAARATASRSARKGGSGLAPSLDENRYLRLLRVVARDPHLAAADPLSVSVAVAMLWLGPRWGKLRPPPPTARCAELVQLARATAHSKAGARLGRLLRGPASAPRSKSGDASNDGDATLAKDDRTVLLGILGVTAAFGCGWRRSGFAPNAPGWDGIWAGARQALVKCLTMVALDRHRQLARRVPGYPIRQRDNALLFSAATADAAQLYVVLTGADGAIDVGKAFDIQCTGRGALLQCATSGRVQWVQPGTSAVFTVTSAARGRLAVGTEQKFSIVAEDRLVVTADDVSVYVARHRKGQKNETRLNRGQSASVAGVNGLQAWNCTCGTKRCRDEHRLDAWNGKKALQEFLTRAVGGRFRSIDMVEEFADSALAPLLANFGCEGVRIRATEVEQRICRRCRHEFVSVHAQDTGIPTTDTAMCPACRQSATVGWKRVARKRLVTDGASPDRHQPRERYRCPHCKNIHLFTHAALDAARRCGECDIELVAPRVRSSGEAAGAAGLAAAREIDQQRAKVRACRREPPTTECPAPRGSTWCPVCRYAGMPLAVAWSGDGRRIATGGVDWNVRVWEVDPGGASTALLRTDLAESGHGACVLAVAWEASTGEVVALDERGELKRWRPEAPPKERCVQALAAWTGRIADGALSADGWTCATTPGGASVIASHWVLEKKKDSTSYRRIDQALEGAQGAVTGIAMTPDAKHIAAGDDSGHITVWQRAEGSIVAQLGDSGAPIHSIAFGRSGDRLAAGDAKGVVRVWRAGTSRKLCEARVRDNATDAVTALTVRPAEDMVACGTEQGALVLIGVDDGRRIELEPHRGRLNALAFSPDGHRLLSAGDDGRLRCHERPAEATEPPTRVQCWPLAVPPSRTQRGLWLHVATGAGAVDDADLALNQDVHRQWQSDTREALAAADDDEADDSDLLPDTEGWNTWTQDTDSADE